MSGIRFLKWGLAFLAASALLTAGVPPATGKNVDYEAGWDITRALVWWSASNAGNMGRHYNVGDSRSMFALTYPGTIYGFWGAPVDPTTSNWGNKRWPGAQAGYDTPIHANGWGVLALTNVGGEKWVSWTGPRQPSEDIEEMIYDIENGPERDWGFDTRTPPWTNQSGTPNNPPGSPTANWWPGAAPQTGDPFGSSPYNIHNFDYGVYPPVQNTAEEILISQWRSQNDVVTTRKMYAWSNQDFDDFVIVELEFENQGSQALNDAYFGVMGTFYVNEGGKAFRWSQEQRYITYEQPGGLDDWFNYSEATNFDGDPAARGKFISYQFDGNAVQSVDDDTGDPYIREFEHPLSGFPGSTFRPDGTPLSPAYVGVAPLAFRNSGASHTFNAADQAAGYVDPGSDGPLMHWYNVFGDNNIDDPTRGALSPAEMYDFFTGPTMDQPAEFGMVWSDQIYGPYNLGPGDRAKVVLVYVFGTGADADPGNIESNTGYPKDLTGWSWNLGTSGKGGDPATLKPELAKGEQTMLSHLSHAQFAYDNEFRIPTSPPDVSFSIGDNEFAQNQVTFPGDAEQSTNPDYGEADVTAYRVYRSSFQDYGPFELLEEIPATGKSEYVFDDDTSVAGFGYTYSIRAVASPKTTWSEGGRTMADLPQVVQDHLSRGLEGGYGAVEQKMLVARSPSAPGLPVFNRLERKVQVVPNPYTLADETGSYQGVEKIRFVGIPEKCVIHVFSVSGDLQSEIHHDKAGVGELSWLSFQNLVATDEVRSGVYFYVVESLMPESLGKVDKGIFVIQR